MRDCQHRAGGHDRSQVRAPWRLLRCTSSTEEAFLHSPSDAVSHTLRFMRALIAFSRPHTIIGTAVSDAAHVSAPLV